MASPRIISAGSLGLALSLFLATGGCALDGQALFEEQGCLICHRFQGRGGYMGPDLTAVAGRRSAEWMARQLRNPKEIDVRSRMPAYDKLSSREARAIINYLKD